MHKDPFGGTLRYEVDRLFDHLVHTAWRGSGVRGGVCPPIEIREDAEAYRVEIDVPGVKRENMTISSERGLLRIEGVRNRTVLQPGERVHLAEQRYGGFARTLRLPPDADPDSVRAQLTDGVLRLEISKRGAGRKA